MNIAPTLVESYESTIRDALSRISQTNETYASAAEKLHISQLALEILADHYNNTPPPNEIRGMFSTRVKHVLDRMEISTLDQLTKLTSEDLNSQRNIGATSLEEVRTKLGELGLALAGESVYTDSQPKRQINTPSKINELVIPKSLMKRLYNCGIKTLENLTERTAEDLLGLHGIGTGKLENIERALASYNLRLKSSEVSAPIDKRNKYSVEYLIELAESGGTLGEIGGEIGRTRERVRQLMGKKVEYNGKKTSLEEIKREAKKKKIEDESARKIAIAEALSIHIQRKYAEAPLEERRAFDYLSGHGHSPQQVYQNFEKYSKVLKNYQEAIDAGEKISLEELTTRSGLDRNKVMTVHRILQTLGLPNPSGKTAQELPEWKKQALKRIKEKGTNISNAAIAAFLGMKDSHVHLYLGNSNGREGYLAQKGDFRQRLSYKNAPDVYEALDARHSIQEVSTLTGVHPDNIIDATIHRVEISKELRALLSTIFPHRKSKKPYLTQEERKQVYKSER